MNFNIRSSLPHVVAILVFLAISAYYLSPVFDGYSLKQDDINNHVGVAKEIYDYRKTYEEEPLWQTQCLEVCLLHRFHWRMVVIS